VVALAAERERALSSGGWGAEADSHSHSHSHSPLAAAAGLSLRTHDGFDWLTYRQLGRLSARVARGLAGLGAGGRFVAVCGYNSFEWAVADFAAARAGAGVVGIHATYSKEVILRVLRICRPHVLVVHSDMWLPATTRDPRRKGLWSVVEVAGAAHAFLKHIVVADLGAEQTQALLDRPEMVCVCAIDCVNV
jgi:long-subunit acyl-CoA synthetase (AMP-forming)